MKFSNVYIGVNYHSDDNAAEWAESVRGNDPEALVVLVDNTEGIGSELRAGLSSAVDGVVYLDTQDNLGYLNGANFGYRYLRDHHIDFDWLFVCNVDIRLASIGVTNILEPYQNASVAMIAPRIESVGSGLDKNPYRLSRPAKRDVIIKKIAFSNMLFANVYGWLSRKRDSAKKNAEKAEYKEGREIYLPYGACFVISRTFFECGGTISFPLFLFGEELFLAEQCLQMGKRIVYVPSVCFKNLEHVSTSKLARKYVTEQNHKVMDYVLRNFY